MRWPAVSPTQALIYTTLRTPGDEKILSREGHGLPCPAWWACGGVLKSVNARFEDPLSR